VTTSNSVFPQLLRTTAFRLSLAYLLVFTIFAFLILGYVAWNARRVLDDQIIDTRFVHEALVLTHVQHSTA